MKYIVDIDGTICNNTFGDYQSAQPLVDRIEHFNKLFDLTQMFHLRFV